METGLPIVAGVAISLASNAVFGGGIGGVSRERDVRQTPKDGAFAIWGVIYLWLAVGAAYAWRERPNSQACNLLGASLLLTAVWVPLFVRNTVPSLAAAALVLLASLGCAIAAVALSGPFDRGDLPKSLLFDGALSLYGGWLCCAAFLGVGIAAKAWSGKEAPEWGLYALSTCVSVASILLRAPVLPLPAMWAVALQREVGGLEYASLANLAVAAAAAALRR